MLFGVMAIQVKRKAPNCHTILEVVRLRWGVPAHLVRTCCPVLLASLHQGSIVV